MLFVVYTTFSNFQPASMQQFTELKVKQRETSKIKHSLFLRGHRVREKAPEKPPEKTLFVAGVPPFFNKDTLQTIFSAFGDIKVIYEHKNPSPRAPDKEYSRWFKVNSPITGYKVAYVVYKKESGLEKALKNKQEVVLPKDYTTTGIQKWAAEYNNSIVDPVSMEKEVDKFMRRFDANEAKEQKKEKTSMKEDDEGWVTVTKKGRNPGFARKESVKQQLEKQGERQRQKKELTNFYRFQVKESKMKNLVNLRQKFEEDKKRIAALKATRRFKPF